MPLNSRKNPGNAPFFTKIVLANQLLTKKTLFVQHFPKRSIQGRVDKGSEAIDSYG